MPKCGVLRAQRGLKWLLRQILPPRYLGEGSIYNGIKCATFWAFCHPTLEERDRERSRGRWLESVECDAYTRKVEYVKLKSKFVFIEFIGVPAFSCPTCSCFICFYFKPVIVCFFVELDVLLKKWSVRSREEHTLMSAAYSSLSLATHCSSLGPAFTVSRGILLARSRMLISKKKKEEEEFLVTIWFWNILDDRN